MRDIIAAGLEELGLSQRVPPEAPELLEAYGRALLEKNQVMNLTAITQPDQVARLHMLDCAALLNYMGIVTDGDIRRAMERRESEFFSIRAMDIATLNPKTIGPDEKLIAAEKKMTQHKINSLLVTDDEGKLVGVIQIYDIKL